VSVFFLLHALCELCPRGVYTSSSLLFIGCYIELYWQQPTVCLSVHKWLVALGGPLWTTSMNACMQVSVWTQAFIFLWYISRSVTAKSHTRSIITFFWDSVSVHSPGWPRTHDPPDFLPQPAQCYDYRHAPPHLATLGFFLCVCF
jgi:hypothetical protein